LHFITPSLHHFITSLRLHDAHDDYDAHDAHDMVTYYLQTII